MIVILSSEPGKGKTYQIGTFEEPIVWFDLENRVKRTVDAYYSDKVIDIRQCLKYTADFKENHIATLETFEKELKNLKNVATIAIDGIGDLRDMAVTNWLSYAKTATGTKRKQPQNPGDWEEINDIVRALLFPVINYCRTNNINLVMTAQFKDDYKDDKKMGRIPALKEWMMYNVDTLITLTYEKLKYKAICTKSIIGCWELDITDKSLYDELIELGV